jgi:hypothetical protein
MSSGDVLVLQRLAGNAAVAHFLQRQPDEPATATADGSVFDQAAQEMKGDSENALGQRIELSPELVSAAAGGPAGAGPAGAERVGEEPVGTGPAGAGLVGAGPVGAGPAPVDYDAQVKKRAAQGGMVFGRDEFGLDPSRVEQRFIGDCYLMAAMAAVARANPDAIRKLIKPAGPGKYAVSLYEHRWLLADPVHTEIVDTTVPVGEDGKPLYGTGELTIKGDTEADRPLWPLLIEKAYAQWKGGYNQMGHGGYASEALEALTGHEAGEKKTSSYSAGEIGQIMEKEIKEGKALEASTGDMPPDITPLGTKGNAGEHEGRVGKNKVVFGHAYAIENVETAVGSIDLQNPWGHDHIEDMSLGDFKHCFYSWNEENTK